MFKGSNVFEFTKFQFKKKYNNVVYSGNSNYLLSRQKQEQNCSNNSLIKSTTNYIYCEQLFFIYQYSAKTQ